MLRWVAALALLVVPGAQACLLEPAIPADDQAMEAVMDLQFQHPDGCKRDDLDACPKLPEADAPLVLQGTFVWQSRTDKACSVGGPSVDPVTVTFKGIVRTAEGWLDLRSDPAEIIIPVTDQYTAPSGVPDPNQPLQHSSREYPLTVTISLVGEPSPEALAALEHTDGAVNLFLKAEMGATSAYATTFAIESFLLDGRSALDAAEKASEHGAAGLPPAFLALGLAALAAVVRRK
jgi:hypothetical protein